MDKEIERIKELVKDIDPETSIMDFEGRFLYRLARGNKVGVVVEIGSWLGRSTIWLAKGSSKKVFSIDPHEGSQVHKKKKIRDTYSEFIDNLTKCGVYDRVVPLTFTSRQAWKDWPGISGPTFSKVGLLFIDGSHNYEDVIFDFDAWTICVPIGGIVALHDTIGYKGPAMVAISRIFPSLDWEVIGIAGQIVAAKRVKPTYDLWVWNSFWFLYWITHLILFRLAMRLPKSVKGVLKG